MYESIVMKDMKGVWHCLLAVKLETMAGESGCKVRGTRVGYYFAKSTVSCPSGKSLKDLSLALVKSLAGDFLNSSIFTQRR